MRTVSICLFLLIAVYEASAGGPDNAYLIKRRQIDNVPEALSLLRRFIPSKQNFDEKCQRYAVLLKSMAKEPTDQFTIAELGLIKSSIISNKYKEIDVESLRQLYIDGISKALQSHVDMSMLELVDCLIRKFRSHDAKARTFLNGDELRTTVEQYKDIMSQPLNFLRNPDARHPSLSFTQLQPAIRRTLLDLFQGDVQQLEAKFPQQLHAQAVAQAGPQAYAVSDASASVADSVAGAQTNVATTAHDELSKEELEYLAKLIQSLRDLYSSLPISSNLNARCAAYSKIMDADPNMLSSELVDAVVKDTSTQTNLPHKFLPDKDTRENFLVALNSFSPEQRDPTWVDIIDCVSEWEQDDEDIKVYLNSPELTHAIESMLGTGNENEETPQQ